jgi:hypothetical protein
VAARLLGRRRCSSRSGNGKAEPLMEAMEDAPVDGLTRYPSLSTHQGILRGLDLFGTGVFALSG